MIPAPSQRVISRKRIRKISPKAAWRKHRETSLRSRVPWRTSTSTSTAPISTRRARGPAAQSDWIKQNPAVNIEIEGHADNRGATEYNLALGARRAQAVKDYLVTLGNAPDRLSTISYGEELSVRSASGSTAAGSKPWSAGARTACAFRRQVSKAGVLRSAPCPGLPVIPLTVLPMREGSMWMRMVSPAVLAVLFLAALWGCQVEYHPPVPVPYDRAPLTEAEREELNQLKAQFDDTRKQLADTRAELAAVGGRVNAMEGAVQEIRTGGARGSGSFTEFKDRLAAVETEVQKQRSSCGFARKSCGCCGTSCSRRTRPRQSPRWRIRRPPDPEKPSRTPRRSPPPRPRWPRSRRWPNGTTRTRGSG